MMQTSWSRLFNHHIPSKLQLHWTLFFHWDDPQRRHVWWTPSVGEGRRTSGPTDHTAARCISPGMSTCKETLHLCHAENSRIKVSEEIVCLLLRVSVITDVRWRSRACIFGWGVSVLLQSLLHSVKIYIVNFLVGVIFLLWSKSFCMHS